MVSFETLSCAKLHIGTYINHGRKCAVKNCRSGYKTAKEDEQKIKTGEAVLTKKHLFPFPTETSLRLSWLVPSCWGRYLLEVPLEEIQSDRIKSHFGHLRKLSGGNYWSSVRQFLENEAVIRTQRLLWWSGFSPADASARTAPSRQERQQEDVLVIQELVTAVASSAVLEDLDDSVKASLGYIFGALARSATRCNKCGACASLLIDQRATPLEVRLKEDGRQMEAIFLY